MRILLIRFSAIGDLVLTTPLIRALHQQLGAEVHLVVKANFAGVLANNPYLKAVHVWEDSKAKACMAALRACEFEQVLDLQHNWRSRRITWHLGLPVKRLHKLNIAKWLLTNFKWDYLPKDLHVVERYLATAAHLGVKADGQGLDYPIAPEAEAQPQRLGLAPEQYLALVIGAAHATKRLPEDKLLEFCQILAPHYPLVLLGGAEDRAVAEGIKAQIPAVHNLCGQCSFQTSASWLRQAKAVIAHDTGFMHIAAAYYKPIAVIWGNTVPAFGMGPYYGAAHIPKLYLQVPNLACRPCSKIGHKACPKGHFACMRQQDFLAVLAWLQML